MEKISGIEIRTFYKYLNELNQIGFDKELLDIISKIMNNCKNCNEFFKLSSNPVI